MPNNFLRGGALGFFPSLTKLMNLISEHLFGLYDDTKYFSVITNSQRTLSCLKKPL